MHAVSTAIRCNTQAFLLMACAMLLAMSCSPTPQQRTPPTSTPPPSKQIGDNGNAESDNPGRLSNQETSTAEQTRLAKEAESCLEDDKISNIVVLTGGEKLDDLDITHLYTSGKLFEEGKELVKLAERTHDPENPPAELSEPPKEKETTARHQQPQHLIKQQ